jgi:hypothetical protein
MGAWEFVENRPGRVFYPPKNGVTVTDRHMVARGRKYELKHLTKLGWTRSSTRTARRATRQMIAVEGALMVVVTVAGMAAYRVSILFGVMATAALFAIGGLLWASTRRAPSPLLLCADYRGVATVLYASDDDVEFHKVCRAVMRAHERYAEESGQGG